jgi:hypothetical protein
MPEDFGSEDDEDDSSQEGQHQEKEEEEEEEEEEEDEEQSDDEVTKMVKSKLKADQGSDEELFSAFSFTKRKGAAVVNKKAISKHPARNAVEKKRPAKLLESRKPAKKAEKFLKPQREGERRSDVRT